MSKTVTKTKKVIEVKNKTDSSAELYFYSDILDENWEKCCEEDKCPSDVLYALKDVEGVKELNIYINSGGGSVWAGIAIYNILKRNTAKKIVHIDGLAASIASVIALAGDEIIMPSNSYMMIHKAACIAAGNSEDLRDVADKLEQIEGSIVDVYMKNVKENVDEKTIRSMMADETWLNADMASQFFEKITVTESFGAVACISSLEYKNTPEGIMKAEDKKPSTQHMPEPEGIGEDVLTELEKIKNFIFLEEENFNE